MTISTTDVLAPVSEWSFTDTRSVVRPVTTKGSQRVLHVINGEHYAGAERVQDLLAARLPEFGFEVGFACVKPGKFLEARQYRQATAYETPMRSRLDLRAALEVARIARQNDYALIHAHTPRSGLIARAASAWCRLPFVYHVHSPTARDTTHGWRNRVNHWMERISLLRANALVTVSHSLRKHMLAQGYSPESVFTIPNGVPVATRRRLVTPPSGRWTLGMTALFRPRKGLEILLEAMAILRREQLVVHLRAVGPFETPAYEREIRDHVNRLGIGDQITWTGFTTDVSSELLKMDLFVLPSLFGEGLPMVVLEAMAAGVPVVATGVEGIPEAVEHGVSGLIAVPNDPLDLARCLRSVIRGEVDWSMIRQFALARHGAEFSDRGMAARLAEIYRQVLASRR